MHEQDNIIPPDFGDPFETAPSKEELSRQYKRQAQEEARQSNYAIHRSAESVSPADSRPPLHTDVTKHGDTTPAHDELEFMRDLFPYQNVKSWNSKSGREFLADFTKATRGQLAVCMSRLATESPKEFARLWVEMEKFNTPQQSSQQIEATVNQSVDLYAKLQAMNQGYDTETIETATPQLLDLDQTDFNDLTN